jgi:hypothetical protein
MMIMIMETQAPKSFSGGSSGRCQRLLSALERYLDRSKDELDLREVVRDFCGDGTGEALTPSKKHHHHDEAILQDLLRSMLHKAHHRVVQETAEFLSDRGIDGALARLDAAEARLERQEAEEEARRSAALESARLATRRANLPPGLSQESILMYHSYRALARDSEELERQIEDGERAVRELEGRREDLARRARRRVENVLMVARELEQSADMCSEVL